jgi:hypothetical protein
MSVVDERSTVRGAPGLEEMIIDPWAALSFKRAMGGRRQAGVSWTNPAWVGEENQRRLLAYKIRDAFAKNIARHFLATLDTKKRSDHREYGDAALLVETVKAALLGDQQQITVEGADQFNEDDDGKQDITTPEGGNAVSTDAKKAQSLEDQLRKWAKKERFLLKMVETERNAIKLGDGLYVLGWDVKKKRPTLTVYDPGTYFPVLDDINLGGNDFPKRVDIAWELDDDAPEGKILVHRITWEVRESDPISLPWEEEPVTEQCYMTEGVWELTKAAGDRVTVHDFQGASVTYVKQPDGTDRQDIPLGHDMLPVVHIPNTVALLDHFGASVLDNVMQILDDIASSDTDLQTASALAGFPVIAVQKARVETKDSQGNTVVTYGPGTLLEVGDGSMSVLDMSAGLTALITYVNHLLERLEVNARVPAGVLGRIKPSDVPSGIALALSFGPLRTMIDEMRLVREDKYRILLRFVTRLFWLNGELDEDPPDEAEAELQFGHFLVVDSQAIVQEATTLLSAHAISRPTALKMLLDAGIPIEDAAKEIAAIQSEDFDAANTLLDITNDVQLVFDWLGIDREPPPEPEPVVPEVDHATGLPVPPTGPPDPRGLPPG